MEKDPKDENLDDLQSTAAENQDDGSNSETKETIVNVDTKPVVVKKSSGGLSMLLALMALAGVVYLYYKEWQAVNHVNKNTVSPSMIQQLQDSDQVLRTEIQNAQGDIEKVKQRSAEISALEQQIKQLSEQLQRLQEATQNVPSDATSTQFDNQANEEALAQLRQQISDQASTIQQLQNTAVTSVGTEQNGATPPIYLEQTARNAAVQVLLNVEVLIQSNRLPQAIETLDRYLNNNNLQASDNNRLLQVLNQLQQIEQPDVVQIRQQLEALQAKVHALQVATEDVASDELRWYDRFISVKKIETDNNISSTAQMVAFKTELSRWLYQAKLYLLLNDQLGWQNSLYAAAKWVQDEQENQASLVAEINQLGSLSVAPKIPRQLSIAAVIEQLQGPR